MLRKTYGVPGKIETVMVLKSGKNDVVVNFKGGSIVDFARHPASYATTNPIHQAIIENSVQFQRGEIKLLSSIEVADQHHEVAAAQKKNVVAPKVVAPKAAPKKAEEPKQEDVKEYPEVTGTQAAIKVLAEYGVDPNLVSNKTDAKRYASELNISFPNL